MELDAIGFWSPWALLWFCLFCVAPLAHMYIVLMLLRDLCVSFPESIYESLQLYIPSLARLADKMKGASWIVDFWCVIEALFFIAFKLKYRYLQSKDPLETSLSAAPMYDPEDRKVLWDRIMEVEKDDLGAFISGWFFDESIENISRYDVCDFLCWCMFDGRNQEHLTSLEYHELESLVEDIEYRISIQLYGVQTEVEIKEGEAGASTTTNRLEKTKTETRMVSPRRRRVHSEEAPTAMSETSSYSTNLYPLPKKSTFSCHFNSANILSPLRLSCKIFVSRLTFTERSLPFSQICMSLTSSDMSSTKASWKIQISILCKISALISTKGHNKLTNLQEPLPTACMKE